MFLNYSSITLFTSQLLKYENYYLTIIFLSMISAYRQRLLTLYRWERKSMSANGDAVGSLKASSAIARSSWLSTCGLSLPSSARLDCANSSATSTSLFRISSIKCCICKSIYVATVKHKFVQPVQNHQTITYKMSLKSIKANIDCRILFHVNCQLHDLKERAWTRLLVNYFIVNLKLIQE